jgi:hypothetical protein
MAKSHDNCDLVVGYSIVPNYASMFRLAGENDAESILKFKVQAQFRARWIPNIKVLVVLEAGAGVLTHLQSLVNALVMLERCYYYVCRNNLV